MCAARCMLTCARLRQENGGERKGSRLSAPCCGACIEKAKVAALELGGLGCVKKGTPKLIKSCGEVQVARTRHPNKQHVLVETVMWCQCQIDCDGQNMPGRGGM
jgi:hypothetical protein